jgi:prepilin-type N-terminal cleavage/methylation domain-containing protein
MTGVNSNKGFSLTEIIISVGVFCILLYMSAVSLNQIQRSRLLSDSLWQLVSIIRENQQKSSSGISSANNHLRFGIVFTNLSYKEFATTGNYANRIQSYDFITNLPPGLSFNNFNLPDSCLGVRDCLLFFPMTGTLSANGKVVIRDTGRQMEKSLLINQEGKITY